MMHDLAIYLSYPVVDALALTLMHFIWQGALLGLVAMMALRLSRTASASTRYLIGVVTLAAMPAVCLATFAFEYTPPVLAEDAAPVTTSTTARDTQAPTAMSGDTITESAPQSGAPATVWRPAISPAVMPVVVSLWALGVFALSLRLVGGWFVARRLARRAVHAVAPSIEHAARQVAAKLRLARRVAIVESAVVAVPTLVGWLKPVVLLPASALSGLTPEQLQAILAHELAHVRRHDYLVNFLQSVVETLLFYHPAAWWVSARVRDEREHCCDDLAIEACGDRIVYVSALAELTTLAAERRLALAATDGSLLSRVQRILGRPRPSSEPTPAWALLAVFVVLGGAASFGASSDAEAVVPRATSQVSASTPVPPSTSAGAKPKQNTTSQLEQELSAYKAVRPRVEQTAAEQSQQRVALPKPNRQVLSGWFDDRFEPPPAPPTPPEPPAPPAAPEPPLPLPPAPVQAPPTPPAPPALPVPPAPPAPPAPVDMPDPGGKGSGNITWSDNGDRLSVKWTGAFRLSDDEKDIGWVEDGATVTFSDGYMFASRVELRGRDGRVERTYRKNGVSRDYEPEGRLFVQAAVDRLIRRSGMFARERVAKRLKSGGPDAVLAAIDELGPSSYVHRVYYTELVKQAQITGPLLTRILQRVPSEISSDYDKATLLVAMAQLPAANDAHRAAVAQAVRSIGSDYDQRRTLSVVLQSRPVAAPVAAAVLDAASTIKSNYDRSLVLTQLAGQGGLSPSTSPAFMALVQSMSSSYEQRRVLNAVSQSGSLADAVLIDAIKSAGGISGSHDQAETLIALADRAALTDASADAFFAAASHISSSYDLRRVLTRVIDKGGLSDRVVDGMLRAAAKIGGSYDRATVLESLAGKARIAGPSRELYVEAARGLGNYDENRALAALVRAEVRR